MQPYPTKADNTYTHSRRLLFTSSASFITKFIFSFNSKTDVRPGEDEDKFPLAFVVHVIQGRLHTDVIAAVSIRAEVMAQADDSILNSGKSELFVQIKLTEKNVTCA